MPRARYSTLKHALIKLGFQNSKTDSFLFIYQNNFVTRYFLVYMEDFVIIGNDLKFVTSLIHSLGTWFSLKDMGQLYIFSLHTQMPNGHAILMIKHLHLLISFSLVLIPSLGDSKTTGSSMLVPLLLLPLIQCGCSLCSTSFLLKNLPTL